MNIRAEQIAEKVILELYSAKEKHGWSNSRHELYAILLEEVDELWDVIKSDGPASRIYAEALQIAAMAIEMATLWGAETDDL